MTCCIFIGVLLTGRSGKVVVSLVEKTASVEVIVSLVVMRPSVEC